MGPEHGGRVRVAGFGVTPTKIFPQTTTMSGQSSKNSCDFGKVDRIEKEFKEFKDESRKFQSEIIEFMQDYRRHQSAQRGSEMVYNLEKMIRLIYFNKFRIIEHCIKKWLQWNNCFARKVRKEGEYYEEMMRYLRKNLALFPYHLAEYVCRVMRISPCKYYCDMLFEVMKNEPDSSSPSLVEEASAAGGCLTLVAADHLRRRCKGKPRSDLKYQ